MTSRRRGFDICSIGLLIVSLTLVPAMNGCAQEADRAYINATVYTVDEDFSTASALADW